MTSFLLDIKKIELLTQPNIDMNIFVFTQRTTNNSGYRFTYLVNAQNVQSTKYEFISLDNETKK